MAIAEHASTPAIATGTGTAAITSASFSPPASSLLVVQVAGGWSDSRMGVTITDSVSGSWTPGVIANDQTGNGYFGYAGVFYRYLSSAPGAMTVTATYSGFTGSGAGGRMLSVRVLTGAASVQGGAIAKATLTDYTTSLTTSITTTTAGSVVYGMADDERLNETISPSSNTAFCAAGGGTNPFPSADTVTLGAIVSSAATGTPGSVSMGVSLPVARNQGQLALFEVLPTGGVPVSKIPTPRTWTTGEVVTDVELDREVRDAINFLLSPPRAVLTVSSAPWSIPTGSPANSINTWDTTLSNSDSMWSPSKPSRLTANTPGRYQLAIYIHFPANGATATTNVHTGIALNSNGVAWASATQLGEDARPGITPNPAPFSTSSFFIFETYLNVGDYVEAYAWQNTGSTQTIGNDPFSCQFSALWIGTT